MGSDKPRAAYVEECDEGDRVVRGTRRSASTKKKSKSDRESRSGKDKKSRSDSGYSSQALITGSEASSPTQKRVEVMKEQSTTKEERWSSSTKSPRKSTRPPLTHQNVTFPIQTSLPVRGKNVPNYFGISPGATTAVAPLHVATTTLPNSSLRTRPQSYYAGMTVAPSVFISRPPPAPSAYFIPPSTILPTSYPPQSPSVSYMKYAPIQTTDSYFTSQPVRSRPLRDRFQSQVADPIPRTSSTSGIKAITEGFYDYDALADMRNSIRIRAKEAEDLERMPPPELPFRRPSIHRIVTDSRDAPNKYAQGYDDEPRNYEKRSARGVFRNELAVPPRRRSTSRSSTYDYPRDESRIRIETPTNRRSSVYDDQSRRSSVYDEPSRRSSLYDGQTRTASTFEEKLRQATGYQDEVAGGPPVSLTAEALRKQQRTASSSHSTRSSGSHESDLKHSATTRTTASRLDPDGDDVTIRFKGGATVNIAGAEIKCQDGAEVNILTRKAIRNGSEKAASEYSTTTMDDRRSRAESRPRSYSRSTSKSKSAYTNLNPVVAATRYREGFF
jgi:hypothetical protein